MAWAGDMPICGSRDEPSLISSESINYRRLAFPLTTELPEHFPELRPIRYQFRSLSGVECGVRLTEGRPLDCKGVT